MVNIYNIMISLYLVSILVLATSQCRESIVVPNLCWIFDDFVLLKFEILRAQ